ncbi:hypothetical protein CHARACLAT_028615 [Characodon lateralis]|uniref:Receptor ligand binding region domain-containing protein n=1 Tax=Characodon lateralis TaxID=208331 RepID=A0ABU7DPE8_9TELE|nr:hypothetical protein [Characodon lateralis]
MNQGRESKGLRRERWQGLLRLEELVRRFLISRETLSVRMLDDNLDPTPLLKEIRDDKVATIIIDANASVSYLILKKASELGMTSAFYKYILTTMVRTCRFSALCNAPSFSLVPPSIHPTPPPLLSERERGGGGG